MRVCKEDGAVPSERTKAMVTDINAGNPSATQQESLFFCKDGQVLE